MLSRKDEIGPKNYSLMYVVRDKNTWMYHVSMPPTNEGCKAPKQKKVPLFGWIRLDLVCKHVINE